MTAWLAVSLFSKKLLDGARHIDGPCLHCLQIALIPRADEDACVTQLFQHQPRERSALIEKTAGVEIALSTCVVVVEAHHFGAPTGTIEAEAAIGGARIVIGRGADRAGVD